MSVTIMDLLKLPCLRNAKVVGGESGINRIVSSVSVLEYTDPTLVQQDFFKQNDFFGNEIVISGFINIKDNIPAQYANIQRLAAVGEVGLILFYVGIFMPSVDRSLIQLADSLGFPLIVMPENRIDLRYSEVICEVMEAIFNDNSNAGNLVGDILEQMSLLPNHQRSIDAVLRLVSDRVRTSLILTDASLRTLGAAPWPRGMSWHPDEWLRESTEAMEYASAEEARNVYHLRIQPANSSPMQLHVFKEGAALGSDVLRHMSEVVQLSVNLWSRQHAEVVVSELVHAIIRDEPIKMRRIADIFHIDVASLNTMWILHTTNIVPSHLLDSVRNLARPYSHSLVADIYEGEIVLFMSGFPTQRDSQTLAEAIRQLFAEQGFALTLLASNRLSNTADVRAAYLMLHANLEDTRKILPHRNQYTQSDMALARDCRGKVNEGEKALDEAMSPLRYLAGEKDAQLLEETLATFLLDVDGSITQAAAQLFVHKNTIKYRLQKISDRIGFDLSHLPELQSLYLAIALWRLLA